MVDPDSGQVKIPRPSVAAVVNAASLLGGAISPGAIVTIFGAGLGPLPASTLRLTGGGAVETQLAGVRVLFDGIPAPLVYVSAGQVSAVAPYGIAGGVTQCEVEFLGLRSEMKEIPVAATAPALFTLNATGSGPGAIVNQDGTVNGSSNPAP